MSFLEENNIPVDYIAGTSMGSIVGGFYASGLSPKEIEETFKSADWKDLFTDRPSRKNLSFRRKQDEKQLIDFEIGFNKKSFTMPRGLIAGQKLGFLLRSKTLQAADIEDFDDLPIPYMAVATDIVTGEMVVLDSGNLAKAIRASMSIPAVFSPVEIDGRLLVDGGIVNNVPVDIARRMGADIIIAVDVGVQLLQRKELRTAIDITRQTLNIMTTKNMQGRISSLRAQDILIRPDMEGISTGDFYKSPEIMKIGEDTALAVLDELKKYAVSDEEFRIFIAKQRKRDLKPIRVGAVKHRPA